MNIVTAWRRAAASQLGQNIVSNYLAVVWLGGLSLLLVPFYLERLGPEQWGIVAICMTLQGLWALLDVGLSQIMPRDVARHDLTAQARVYRIYVRAYWALGLVGFVLGQISVPWLMDHWLMLGPGASNSAEPALRLVLCQFVFQFANNANIGYWNGREQQMLANARQCFFGTVKHVGALGLLFWWQAEAYAYLLSFSIVAAIEWWWNSHLIRKSLGGQEVAPVVWRDFQKLARDAGQLLLGVLIGLPLSQIDRVVLSGHVDVKTFGNYVIVASLGLALMQLQYPLFRAFLPRIARATGAGAGKIYRQLSGMVLLACIVPCAMIAALAPLILRVWIGSEEVVSVGTAPLRMIIFAVMLNAIYNIIYQRMLVEGAGKIVIRINAIALLTVLPLMLLLVKTAGVLAGGYAWMAISSIQLIAGLVWLWRRRSQPPVGRGIDEDSRG